VVHNLAKCPKNLLDEKSLSFPSRHVQSHLKATKWHLLVHFGLREMKHPAIKWRNL
jgi:hypothetical protein